MYAHPDRFWSQVRRGTPDQCWPWLGKTIKGGYGDFRPDGQTHVIAHRWSWTEANGEIPDALFVLHRCDNPPCVNPAHLFLGTQQDNMDDMARKGRKVVLRGEDSGRARLRTEDIREIRRLVNEVGQTATAVANARGLDRRHVARIAAGTKWASVPLREQPRTLKPTGRPRRIRAPGSLIRCGRCGEAKPESEFAPSAVRRGNGYCRPCFSAWGRERYALRKAGE